MTISDITDVIAELEQAEVGWTTIERLAWLYIIRDHLGVIPESVPDMPDSVFTRACSGVPISKVMSILDEHMEVVKALHPKEYNAVIEMLSEDTRV